MLRHTAELRLTHSMPAQHMCILRSVMTRKACANPVEKHWPAGSMIRCAAFSGLHRRG